MTAEEIAEIEKKFRMLSKYHSPHLNGELNTTSDKVGVYVAFGAMDEAYNLGVDHALEIAQMGLDHCELVDNRDGTALLNEMISKIKELKK